jgi:membrane protease YdiL (CAAX protease family)
VIDLKNSKIAIFSPMVVIAIGFIIAYMLSPIMEEWVFIPLALAYWAIIFAISYKNLGKEQFISLFAKPERKALWPILSLVVGFIPLSIFLMNLNLINSPLVIALWLMFAIINPLFEEIYWRGFLLNFLPFSKKIAVIYSTLFFVISHPFMWGVFSIANRSWMTWVSLLIMGIVWSMVYLKTKSLRWCIVSHFMVDIFNLSVFVFLNLYVPPVM